MTKEEYFLIAHNVLKSAQAKDYSGFSKFDALNSPLLKKLSFDNPWLRFFWTQLVKECPLNIRPFLGVRPSRNPKGIALFARAYLFIYERTGNGNYLEEARKLLHWLMEHPSPRQEHLCWGYNFIWQNLPPFLQGEGEPNCVVTVFAGDALIHAYRVTGEEVYLNAARSAAQFISQDLPVLFDCKDERAIAYILGDVDAVVLNNQVLSGAFLTKIWKHTGEDELLQIAIRQMNYTFNRRTDYCAWYYTEPREKSPIRHDNYHTGGILDAFLEYFEETGDERYMDVYWKGLDYYQRTLFESDGAPRWMNDRRYPYDIHGAAQGVITFLKAGRHKKDYAPQADKIAEWAVKNHYRPESCDFIYRRGRFFKWDYSLMRWCNAWMARALAEVALTQGSRT